MCILFLLTLIRACPVRTLDNHCEFKVSKAVPALKEPVARRAEGGGKRGGRLYPVMAPPASSYKISDEWEVISETDKKWLHEQKGLFFISGKKGKSR